MNVAAASKQKFMTFSDEKSSPFYRREEEELLLDDLES